MHQRSCQVIHGLNNELCADLEDQIADNNNADFTVEDQSVTQSNLISVENIPEFKKGLNLPKKDSEWATANDFFKFAIPLNGPIITRDLNLCITQLNDTIYNYFSEHFGNV